MRRSFKQQLLQKSNHHLLNNHIRESTHMLSAELSDEFSGGITNHRIHSKLAPHRTKQ